MKIKNTITIILVLVVAVTTLAFGNHLPFTKGLFSFATQANVQPSSQIPSHILYDKLFRMTVSFKKKADSQSMSDEKIIGLKNYFKNRAQLTEEENELLQKSALEFVQQVSPIDTEARTIILQRRAAYPRSVVPKDEPPPAELVNLQEQRNALALLYRDRLKQSLGSEGAAKFDRYMEGEFASHFEEIKLSEIKFDQDQ